MHHSGTKVSILLHALLNAHEHEWFSFEFEIPSVKEWNPYLHTRTYAHPILIITKFWVCVATFIMISIFQENFNTFKPINFCFFGLNITFFLQPTFCRRRCWGCCQLDSKAPRRNRKSLLLFFAASFYALPSILISLIDYIT